MNISRQFFFSMAQRP